MKPNRKPENPNFSSGPCSKFKGFNVDMLKDTPFGRSHRSPLGKRKLEEAINKSRNLLNLPDDYRIGIVPASDTGAFEMAMWNMLGARAIDVVCFEAFGKGWAYDITEELKLDDVRIIDAPFGKLPDVKSVDCSRDVVFTWNGTTSGVKVENGDWIADDREGLTFCDATSAVFAMEIPWEKIDVCTYSWQKVLGGEGAHGMLILSPRAVERIENYSPSWPLPKIFRLKKGSKLNEGIFKGSTINTPSMLCNEDYLQALNWAESIGGLKGLIKKSEENLEVVEKFVKQYDWIDFLCEEKKQRSNSSICIKFNFEDDKVDEIVKLLKKEEVAYDIASYRDAPKGIRIWGGATVEASDIEIMLEWLLWAYNEIVIN